MSMRSSEVAPITASREKATTIWNENLKSANWKLLLMRKLLAAFALFASCAQVAPVAPIAPVAPVAPGFDFRRTLRIDYFHSGGPGGEALTLDAVIAEGEWPGSRTQLVDTTNLGKYLLEVIE